MSHVDLWEERRGGREAAQMARMARLNATVLYRENSRNALQPNVCLPFLILSSTREEDGWTRVLKGGNIPGILGNLGKFSGNIAGSLSVIYWKFIGNL